MFYLHISYIFQSFYFYLCYRWIQPLGLTWTEEASVVEDGNANLFKQGISAFYDGLVENAHINQVSLNCIVVLFFHVIVL